MKVLAIILATIGALTPVVATGPGAAPHIDVQEEHGLYRVRAHFEVAEAPAIALGVLEDYERIPRFMPDMRRSIVRERSGTRVVVEQEAVASIMMFSKRVHLVLDIREESDALHFTDVCGRSFSQYISTWHVTELDGRTTLSYALDAKPAFSVPEFVLSRLLRRDAAQMIDRLRDEIATRGPVHEGR